MATLAPNDDPTFQIPTVDISGYLADQTSMAAEEVVEKIRAACITSGFFQVTGHGIPELAREGVLNAAKLVFDLSREEKLALTGVPGRGYEAIGDQVLEPGKKADLKEGYYIGREIPNNKPPYRPFHHPNIWPDEKQISNEHFKDPIVKYHQAISNLSAHLMQILGRGLRDIDTSVFKDFSRDPIAVVRLLHYPPHPTMDDPELVGAGAHTDFGAITLLLQDGHSGLQVLNQDTDEWVNVPPNRDSYVVNVGDMLNIWTAGRYKSSVHRVINTSGTDRYSVPFFLDGNADCVIKPLDGSEGKQVTVEEHMMSRFAASYKL